MVAWAIDINRPTLLISLQLPAIKLCLWNKILFCYHVFFLIQLLDDTSQHC